MRGRFVPARLRLVVAAYGVSLTGSSTLPVALTFTVLERRWPTSDIGLIMVATSLPLVLTLPVAGVVGDRVRRGALMVGADGARFVSQGALGLLLLWAQPPFALVFVLVGVVGVGDALFNPSLSALVSAIARGEEQRANALLGVTASVATLAGPALGGLLVAVGRPPAAILLDAGSYAISAMLLTFAIRGIDLPLRAHQGENLLVELRRGWKVFIGETWLWSTGLQFALCNMLAFSPFVVLGAIVAKTRLGGARPWGIILACSGIGAFLGGLIALRMKPSRPLLVASLASFLFAAPIVAMAAGGGVVVIAAGNVASGMGLAVAVALWATATQTRVSPEYLARVSAFDWLGSEALRPVGYALAVPLLHLLGLGEALWVGAATIVATGLAVLTVPAVRSRVGGETEDRPPP